MDYALFVMQVLNGLQLGLLLFLVASGLTLVFGILDFVNLAHASLYMVGALVCASLTLVLGNFVWALLLAIPVTALVGWTVERLVARRLYGRDHLDQVLATFGLILVLTTLAHLIWGPQGISVPLPSWLKGQLAFSDTLIFPIYRLVIIGAGLLAALGLYVLVTHTRLGMLIRAGASNRQMVSALGVNIERLFAIVFSLGAVLAGLAGMLVAPITEASIGMGNGIIITAFVVIIVGGIGSMKGAFIAAMLIGLIDTLGRAFLDGVFKLFMSSDAAENSAPAVSAMLIYIIMALVLAFRPKGLFPPKVR
ncbi:MAG: branched-chain amino acid ABC transporter permease [Burkholderiaceae bacterium]|nr:branched-chain amino acid ABC transporter permease [Burkholderiaceae bacterium]MDC1457743.1 branched-chain amino acid ABC transporter permease [Burkholderiaceae bacterium]MDG1108174.1 branched-chain amino acid ABC transporter permease [Burkholderiaceae bacterium]MDO7578778.1 branched-chain amino acid ABC transporter permease [Burkholderiaceae bacterium]MDO7594239.1 branched-chain amino acid ABC transporter permease [Burkholderiaceae bacterium]